LAAVRIDREEKCFFNFDFSFYFRMQLNLSLNSPPLTILTIQPLLKGPRKEMRMQRRKKRKKKKNLSNFQDWI